MRNFGDYTREQVNAALLFMEQYVQYEDYKELKVALHILRAVNQIGKGTKFLSELTGTSE